MDKLKAYDINFSGLKDGVHHFHFSIDQTFFNLFEFEQDFKYPSLNACIKLEKRETILQFYCHTKGSISFHCDLTYEIFEHPLAFHFQRVVKFGERYIDEGENLIIIPYNTNTINVAQWIYEHFILSLPMKRIHPKVLDGEMNATIFNKLDQMSLQKDRQIKKDQKTDPRWNKLKELLNN